MEYIQIGMGNDNGVTITESDSNGIPNGGESTITQDGFLPNMNAASRFLAQATLGYNIEEIENVALIGIEDWIDLEFDKTSPFTMLNKVKEYHDFVKEETNDPDAFSSMRYWDYTWWQYHMTSNDFLRQRIAFALSELLVISRFSSFGNRSYAFGDYYDIFLNNAFGNYRDILQEVTYHPAMSRYLTYLNNPKTDTTNNTFPDENYARELMQLFTIGLYELNLDGSIKLDSNQEPIPSYDNADIIEFSKIFTGLTWGDRDWFGSMYPHSDTSYTVDLAMWNDHHEPGVKNLLYNEQVEDRNPVDGDADISDALDNLFDHPNTAPFVSKFLIQRLVTSNPSPEYIERVAMQFENNGLGDRGDMKAVIKAILLDPVARSCDSANDPHFGMLREPFIRYVQMNRAFDNSTLSGNHRNEMHYAYQLLEQKPNSSPSVFNFFQPDHQPIGPIEQAGLVAPEFQLTNSKTITGYINGLYRWIIEENPADEWNLFQGEDPASYQDELAEWDISDEQLLSEDDKVHMLVDRLNLLIAQGRLSSMTENVIIETIKNFPADDDDDLKLRAKLAIYLVMSSPEYLINR